MLLGFPQFSKKSMVGVTPASFSLYLFITFHLLREATSQSLYSPIPDPLGSSTDLSGASSSSVTSLVTSLISTISFGSPDLSSQTSDLPGGTTTEPCNGITSACYISAAPTPIDSATCSGTSDPNAIYVTQTTTQSLYLTVSGNFSTPPPVYITPLPFCNQSAEEGFQRRQNDESTSSFLTFRRRSYYGNGTSTSMSTSTSTSMSTSTSTSMSTSTSTSMSTSTSTSMSTSTSTSMSTSTSTSFSTSTATITSTSTSTGTFTSISSSISTTVSTTPSIESTLNSNSTQSTTTAQTSIGTRTFQYKTSQSTTSTSTEVLLSTGEGLTSTYPGTTAISMNGTQTSLSSTGSPTGSSLSTGEGLSSTYPGTTAISMNGTQTSLSSTGSPTGSSLSTGEGLSSTYPDTTAISMNGTQTSQGFNSTFLSTTALSTESFRYSTVTNTAETSPAPPPPSTYTTILVTKKTSILIQQPTTPGLAFGSSTVGSSPQIPDTTPTTSPQPVSSKSSGSTTAPPAPPALGSIIASIFNNPPIPPKQPPTTSENPPAAPQHTTPAAESPPASPQHTTPAAESPPASPQHTNPAAESQGTQPGSSLVSTLGNHLPGPAPSSVTINNVPVQVGPGVVVIGGQTISPATVTAPVVIEGQTFSISPSQVVAPGGNVLSIPAVNPPPPTTAPSVLTVAGLPFTQVAPSELQISGSTIYIPPQGTTAVVDGKTYTIYPSSIAGSGTTLALPFQPTNAPAVVGFTAITAAGLTFELGASEAVISGTTYEIGAGATPTAIIVGGETITLGSAGLVLPSVTLAPLASAPPTWSTISADGLVFSIEPGEVFISGTEYAIGNGATPTVVVVGGKTVAIGTNGVVLPSTTVAAPGGVLPTWSAVSAEGLVFSVEPGEVYISGTEYAIGNGATPKTIVFGGETAVIGTNGVVLPSTTIAPPGGVLPTWSAVSADGLVFSIEPGEVYISGTEYAIGNGATPTTVVVGGETVVIGTNGVVLPSTTIAPPGGVLPTWSAVSAEGLVFSIEPGEVYISGTEYAIGNGATPTTIVVGGETVVIGTNGVVLPSTTIAPPGGVLPTWSAVSADGLVFSIEPGEVYISGTEYAIGSGATPTTVVVGGETVVIGTNGVVLPSTTIAPPGGVLPTWSAVSAEGLAFSIEPGEVYISGTEYAIGSGATPTTVVFGGETVVVGPNGVILPSTTIAAPTETGFGFTGAGTCLGATTSTYWSALLIALMGALILL